MLLLVAWLANRATVPTATMTTSMNIKMRRRRRLLSIVRSPELIADAVHCLEIERLIRIGFDFLPQVHKVKVYRTVKAVVVQTKDTFHQFQATKRPARVAGKCFKEFEFLWREVDGFPAQPDFMSLQVNHQISKMQCRWTFF